MKPIQPYLLRAFYSWLNDCELTPYVLVDATVKDVDVPKWLVKDGKIVLCISPAATINFEFGDAGILFDATFSGQSTHLSIPYPAIDAIYAKENGEGMFFTDEQKHALARPQLVAADSQQQPIEQKKQSEGNESVSLTEDATASVSDKKEGGSKKTSGPVLRRIK